MTLVGLEKEGREGTKGVNEATPRNFKKLRLVISFGISNHVTKNVTLSPSHNGGKISKPLMEAHPDTDIDSPFLRDKYTNLPEPQHQAKGYKGQSCYIL